MSSVIAAASQMVHVQGCAVQLKLQGPYAELPGADSGTLAPRKLQAAGHHHRHSLKQDGVIIVAGEHLANHCGC